MHVFVSLVFFFICLYRIFASNLEYELKIECPVTGNCKSARKYILTLNTLATKILPYYYSKLTKHFLHIMFSL